MRTKKVVVVPYDPSWSENFLILRKELEEALQGRFLAIEHVGSTSVPYLCAKPILDVDVVIGNEPEDFIATRDALARIGYIHRGNLDIEGREAFAYTGKEHLQAHHLYVCPENSKELHRHLTFRDHLRLCAEDRERYAEIKREAAALFPEDIDSYIEYKGQVILEIYKKLGLA